MNPMEPEPIAEALSGIPPDRVVESYHSRKLEALSETELFRAAAHIVSQPKLELSSFRLFAPLEIMARYNLLPLVAGRPGSGWNTDGGNCLALPRCRRRSQPT